MLKPGNAKTFKENAGNFIVSAIDFQVRKFEELHNLLRVQTKK